MRSYRTNIARARRRNETNLATFSMSSICSILCTISRVIFFYRVMSARLSYPRALSRCKTNMIIIIIV
jgi:hypothetical protein